MHSLGVKEKHCSLHCHLEYDKIGQCNPLIPSAKHEAMNTIFSMFLVAYRKGLNLSPRDYTSSRILRAISTIIGLILLIFS